MSEPDVSATNATDTNDETLIMQGVEPGSAAGMLLNLFLTARFARRNQDTIWMTAYRNVRSRYGNEVALQDGWSSAFVNMTSPKVQTAFAILSDVLLPQGKDIWGVDPTPEPFMPEFTEYLAQQNAQQGINADYETFKNQIFLESQRRCMNLNSKIRDGMAETDFKPKLLDAIYDLCLMGGMCMYGPFPKERQHKVRGTRTGKKARKSYLYPEFEHVSLFDVYPDPGARSVEDCLYVCRRRVVNKAWISGMREVGGFMTNRLDYVMEHAPDGNWTPEPWETDMITANNNNQMYTYRHRYVVYDFWMKKTSKELIEYGVSPEEIDLDDPNRMYTANIMVCNAQVIRATVSEFHEDRLPIYIAQCRKNLHSIWGTGFPEMMFDSQASGSACERAANDTMASIARPQTVLDMSRVKMGTDALKPHPGKIWMTNNAVGGSTKPVDIFYPPNILKEVLERQAAARAWAQEETGIPDFLMGNNAAGTHNRTLGGAELQWNNATNPFKTVVSNIEQKLIIPAVEKVADFYLTYEFSDEIDADYKVTSSALQGLVAKMARVQSIMEMMKAVGNNAYWQNRFNDKRIGEIFEDAFSLTGEAIFLNDADAKKKAEAAAQQKSSEEPQMKPEIPLRDAKLKVLSETDKGSAAYPVVLEAAMEELHMLDGKPATAAALNIMREETLTAHRQFESATDVQALKKDVNPDGSGNDVPDAGVQQPTGQVTPNAPSGDTWRPGQPGAIPPQNVPTATPGGVVMAPLPLGVKSLGTPKAESLVEHPERYSTSIPPGQATNPADVGGNGLPMSPVSK